MAILIKRYANRKLYNTETSRYITLKGIAELIDAGSEVQVIDNETGEDITNVALSQILVDNERSNPGAPNNVLSQILGRGGDALYEALRRGVDDASENFEEMQDRLRRFVDGGGRARSSAREDAAAHDEPSRRGGRSESGRRSGSDGRKLSDWIAYASPDFDQIVQNAVERVFKVLDLPRRSDIESLNENLQRVALALEDLERGLEAPTSGDSASSDEPA